MASRFLFLRCSIINQFKFRYISLKVLSTIFISAFSINIYPQNSAGQGLGYIGRGDFVTAEKYFSKGIEEALNDPSTTDCLYELAYGGRGFCRLEQKKYAEAMKDLIIALKYNCDERSRITDQKRLNIARLHVKMEIKNSVSTELEHEVVAKMYFDAIAEKDVYQAVHFFIPSKRNKIEKIIQKIADETEYIKINSIDIIEGGTYWKVLKINLTQKLFQKPGPDNWEVKMKLIRNDSYSNWEIESVK